MNIFRTLTFVFIPFLLIINLVSCGGGGDGSGYLSHEEMAERFVDALKIRLGYNIDLVKAKTLKYNYIVVYNYNRKEFDAYEIGNYDPGDSIVSYLDRYDDKFYYDIDKIGPNLYEDFWTGVRFEDTHITTRSSSAHQKHLSNVFQRAKVEAFRGQFGLSYERSTKLVTLAMNYKVLTRNRVPTEDELNDLAMEVVGTPATELYQIAKEGDMLKGCKALKQAAKTNDIGVEHAKSLISEHFGLNQPGLDLLCR